MKTRKIASGGIVAFIVAAAMVVGIGAPAHAWTPFELWEYVSTIRGEQLAATNKQHVRQAWSGAADAAAARSASYASAGQVYGTVTRGNMAEVIPLNKPKDGPPGSDPSLGKKLTVKGTGVRVPVTAAKDFIKGVGPVAGPTAALTGYLYRAEISNGLLSLVGIDAAGEVCGEDQGVIINFLSGQDCEAYKIQSEFIPNVGELDVPEGWSNNVFTYDTQNGANPAAIFMTAWDVSTVLPAATYTVGETMLKLGAQSGVRQSQYVKTFCRKDTAPFTIVQGTLGGPSNPPVGSRLTHSSQCLAGHKLVRLEVSVSSSQPQHIAQWGAQGTEWYSPGRSSNPDRVLECRITASNGQTYTGRSNTYKETDAQMPKPTCPALPAGVFPEKTKLVVTGPPPVEEYTIWEEDADPSYKKYNDEFGVMCAAKTCVQDLVEVASGLSCFGLGAKCDGWFTDPQRDTKYRCEYGGKTDVIQSCFMYSQIFNEQRRLAGDAYTDPETGKPINGGPTARPYDETWMRNPVRSPDQVRGCLPKWGEPNPLVWVLKPIQCGLEWAFVPSPTAVVRHVEDMKDEWEETPPGKLMAVMGAWTFNFTVTGCNGFPLKTPFTWAGHSTDINWGIPSACPGTPFAPFAANMRLFGSIAIVIGTAYSVARAAGASIGFNKG